MLSKANMAILVLVLVLLTGCKTQATEDIDKVKSYIPSGSAISMGGALNIITQNAKWEYQQDHIVKFTGNCLYAGMPALLEIYFRVPEKMSPIVSNLFINGYLGTPMDFQSIFISAQQISNSPVSFKGKQKKSDKEYDESNKAAKVAVDKAATAASKAKDGHNDAAMSWQRESNYAQQEARYKKADADIERKFNN
jgi:hypothetical protein